MQSKKLLCGALVAVMLISGVGSAPAGTVSANRFPFQIEAQAAQKATGINVAYHSKKQIRDYIKKHPATLSDKITYKKKPVTSGNYAPGQISAKTSKSALNMLNQVRYIAGISADVKLNNQYMKLTQAASLLNYANNELSHFPAKPKNMSNEMYELGADGASSSNIAWSSRSGWSLTDAIINAWMEDGDDYNIDRIGHRRWLLNPYMAETGFGVVDGSNGTYSTVYAFDTGNANASEYGVCWPAQNMPVEYFGADFPWSVSTGVAENPSKVKVTLTNLSTKKTWNFSAQKANGDFYINNDGYGQKGCIIFRPSGITGYANGDSYEVKISGLTNGPVCYKVNFFKL